MSMITPPTSNPSVASSVFSQMSKTSTRLATVVTNPQDLRLPKKDILWKRYKQKNEEAARRHFDEKSAKSFSTRRKSIASQDEPDKIHVEGQNVMKLNATLAPTTIFDLPYPGNMRNEKSFNYSGPAVKSHSHLSRTVEAPKPPTNVPFPFMPALANKRLGIPRGKRVIFDRSDFDNILQQIEDQIKTKKANEESEMERKRKDEQSILNENRQRLMEEIENYANDREHKREAFDAANRILKEERAKRDEEEMQMKSLDKLNYFPFTHGDLIDKQRSVLSEIIRNEQIQAIKDKITAQAQLRRERN